MNIIGHKGVVDYTELGHKGVVDYTELGHKGVVDCTELSRAQKDADSCDSARRVICWQVF